MAISYVNAGAGASGTGAITPTLAFGLAADDILIMVVETANQAVSISNAAGGTWTSVTSPQGTGTAGGLTSTLCHVFWSRYPGASQTAPTIADAGDHTAARIYAYRGCVTTGSPINAATGNVDATSDNSLSANGVTTTVDNCWVVVAATLMDDAQDFGASWTNVNLTGITVRNASFGHAAGNDGRLILVDGVKAAAGATGATTNTLTSTSTKAMITFALAPAATGGAVTLTVPTVFKVTAVAVTPTPQPVTTTITPVTIRALAVALTGAGGPSSLVLTPVTLKPRAVAVTPTPQPVTTEITPVTATVETGRMIVPLIESFNKANGAPLGPDRAWARHIYTGTDQFVIASNAATLAVTSAPTDLSEKDLQVPSPNIAGIPNQQASIVFTSVNHPDIAGYAYGAALLLRFALYAGDTNFRGYSATVVWNDAATPGVADHAVWLVLARFDAHDQLTILSVDGVGADAVPFDLGAVLPGTLTARADGNQISARFTHSGNRALAVAATDTTWTDGDVALWGQADLKATDTAHVTVDDLYAYTAPAVPSTVEMRTPRYLRLFTAPVVFIDGIHAGDSATPPTDIYDAGDTATPPTDLNDPEFGLTLINALTVTLEAVPVNPVGDGPGQTPITPAVLHLDAGVATPIARTVVAQITESFNKTDGALGPDQTWISYVDGLGPNVLEVAGNEVQLLGTAVSEEDGQYPAAVLNSSNQLARLAVTTISFTSTDYWVGIGVNVRIAFDGAGTYWWGYAAEIGRNNQIIPGVDRWTMVIWRVDRRLTPPADAVVIGIATAPSGDVALPGTLTLTAIGSTIACTFTHAGGGATLQASVTDATFATGDVGVGAGHSLPNGTGNAKGDSFLAASIGTVTPTPVEATLTAPAVTATPGQATTTVTAPTLRVRAVALAPLGSGTGAVTLTPVVLHLIAVVPVPPVEAAVIPLLFTDPIQAVTFTDPVQALTFTSRDQTLVLTDVSHALTLIDPDRELFLVDFDMALAF